MQNYQVPTFLNELLQAKSPSGYESEAQTVFDRHVKPATDAYTNDPMGNRIATLNPEGDPVLMLAGHLDELGLIITYINEQGFLYFDTIGGHDLTVVSGRRVIIQTANGPVVGVTGKRAIHLMTPEDRKKVPEKHEMWIDIAVADKAEAHERVALGDVATYDHELPRKRSECVVRLRQPMQLIRTSRWQSMSVMPPITLIAIIVSMAKRNSVAAPSFVVALTSTQRSINVSSMPLKKLGSLINSKLTLALPAQMPVQSRRHAAVLLPD